MSLGAPWSHLTGMTHLSSGLHVGIIDKVGYLVIDRQERLNALSKAVQKDIIETIDGYSSSSDAWGVILSAAGSRAFSAGVDLKEVSEADQNGTAMQRPMTGSMRNVFETVYDCAKPTMAVLNGLAVGGGCEIALACDLRIASNDAVIGMPESKRGMGAAFGSALLPRLIPAALAFEMLYFGESIPASRAAEIGLVNRVVPLDDLGELATDMMGELVKRAPLTVRRYKAVINRTRELPLAAALRTDVQPDPYGSWDRSEGVAAFAEKREPQWEAR
jgi:enoyl-CoA hydratase